MFTRNRFPGAPVIVGRKHIANGFAQALVINSKNANVAMGKQGIDNAVETCQIVGAELGVDAYDVLPFSTGRHRPAVADGQDPRRPQRHS